MKFLHVNANEMNYVVHEGITGIHTIIQITSQILLRLFLTGLFNAELLTIRVTLLMSTNPRLRRAQALRPISNASQHPTKLPRCLALTRASENADQIPLLSPALSPEEQQQSYKKILNQVKIPISTSNLKITTPQERTEDDHNTRYTDTSNSKLQTNQPIFMTDPHRKAGQTSDRCPLRFTSRLSKAPCLNETPTAGLSVSQITGGQSRSTIKNAPFIQRKTDGYQKSVKVELLRRITESSVPHLKIDHKPDNECTQTSTSGTISRRIVARKESNRLSVSSQRNIAEILNKKESSTMSEPSLKKLVTSSTKSKRSKTDMLVRSKSRHKPDSSKVEIAFPVKLKKRHRGRKSRLCKSKNSSTTESSDRLDLCNDISGVAGVKLVAAGQHGFVKNASTGTDSIETSFTIVNVDAFPTDSVKDKNETTTRVVGTSIQDEFVSKRGVHFPHPAHRSVCIQADGSDKGPCDTKALFQKLLPRINALATKRKQPALNSSSSGQSSCSNFWSNSSSYHGSQSVQSTSERALRTSVDIQYGSSGNVRAVVRTSSNFHSKYSSRSSAVWLSDRLTPIIQGISLTPPRTPSAQQSQTLPKNSSSVNSRRSGPPKDRS